MFTLNLYTQKPNGYVSENIFSKVPHPYLGPTALKKGEVIVLCHSHYGMTNVETNLLQKTSDIPNPFTSIGCPSKLWSLYKN